MGNSAETKIPALSKADLKVLEDLEKSVESHIQGLREAAAILCELANKNSKSKDLQEFNTWVYNTKLCYIDERVNNQVSPLSDLQFSFKDVVADFKERQNYQKVYRRGFADLDYDYLDKDDLSPNGLSQCDKCGSWLFDDEESCPVCNPCILPNPLDSLEPYQLESGLIIDPLLMDFKDIERIFGKTKVKL